MNDPRPGRQRLIDAAPAAPSEPAPGRLRIGRFGRIAIVAGSALLLLSLVGELTGAPELTSSGTFAAAFRLGVPILLAGLGAVFSERAGVVNIGLEGMMILGTWFGAYFAWMYGPWWGVLAAIIGGGLGGLLHALATVTFGIDHIISGVAVNILAAGVARFLSVIAYAPGSGGGATQSPRIAETIPRASLPFLSGGSLFGWETPNLLRWLELQNVFFVSDLAGLLRALTTNVSWVLVIALVLVPVTWFVLWRTPTGLRMRSVGEHPVAAESVGVPVYAMKYLAVTLSGMLAGLGGAVLVLEAAGIYREGQTGGRGFIALAAMIFGNWRPGGTAAAAGLFGYADALQLRDESAVHGLLLFVALGLLILGLLAAWRRRVRQAIGVLVVALLVGLWFAATDSVPREFVSVTPHITTLLVLALATQRLRMPAADGLQYRKGQSS
jgi:simple sugar transport system permease protein